MTDESAKAFEQSWPGIARDLDVVLARRGVDLQAREDIIQETALRLIDRWDHLDKERPLMPLAATIALNLMRDRHRRGRHEALSDRLSVSIPGGDVEREGIARLELGRVAGVMKHLSRAQREALLIGIRSWRSQGLPEDAFAGRSPAAVKMLRMRARKRLATLLQGSGAIVVSLRMKLHAHWRDPGTVTAAALGAGALLVSALTMGDLGPGAPQTVDPGSVGRPSSVHIADLSGTATPGVAGDAPGRVAPWEIRGAPPREPAAAPEEAGDEATRAEAGANVELSPEGETVVEADAGPVAVKVRRSRDEAEDSDHYSLCLSLCSSPNGGSDCSD